MEAAGAQLSSWMGLALRQAELALEHDDVPVGAVVVHSTTGEVVATAHNARERDHDPTAHAELIALRTAADRVGSWRLTDYTLVATLEPCPMCAGAVWAARIGRLIFGAPDAKAGAAGTLYNFATDPRLNHDTEVVAGVRAQECGELLTSFFRSRRSG